MVESVLVSFSPVDVFGDQFGNAEQHALEIGVLVVVLNLEERDKANFSVLEGLLTTLLNEKITIRKLLESESNQESEETPNSMRWK